MRACLACGHADLPDYAKVCGHCGTKLPEAAPITPTERAEAENAPGVPPTAITPLSMMAKSAQSDASKVDVEIPDDTGGVTEPIGAAAATPVERAPEPPRPPPAAPTPAAASPVDNDPEPPYHLIPAIGTFALVVSAFLPWLSVSDFSVYPMDDLAMWVLWDFSRPDTDPAFGYVLLAVALLAGVATVTRRKLLMIAAGVLGLVVAADFYIKLAAWSPHSAFDLIGTGFWAFVAGSVVLILGALKERRS